MFAALKTYVYLQKPRKAKENDENTNKNNKHYNTKLMKTPIKPINNYETTHENTSKTNNNYETTLIKTMKQTHENTNKTNQNKGRKTRCSPRTRMLTRMLMVQMSKHMDMQLRRTLL